MPTFVSAIHNLNPIISTPKQLCLYAWSRACSTLPGDMAEVGVYKGDSCLLLARANPAKTVHAFDTFAGIPNARAGDDLHANGDFADLNRQDVIDRLEAQPNIRVHVGVFPQTADDYLRFCFAHFDGDTYQSCRDFLAYFWPRLSAGGVLLFDDYKWERCPGVERAIREFGLEPVETVQFQCLVQKM